jgi:hypothetical protein
LKGKYERNPYIWPTNENGAWRIRYDHELNQLHVELDIIAVVKAGRLKWLGHQSRENDKNPRKELTFTKMEGTVRVEKPP